MLELLKDNFKKFFTVKVGRGTTPVRTSANWIVDGHQSYVPFSSETKNINKLTMYLTVNTTLGFVPGVKFTIAAINSLSTNKINTRLPKTFTVISVINSTILEISPPIIIGDGFSGTEDEYANCSEEAMDRANIVLIGSEEESI